MRTASIGVMALAASCASPPAADVPRASSAPVRQASAAPPPADSTPDEPFRARRPPTGPPITWVPPRIERATLAGGLPALIVERHDLPIVFLQVLVPGGWAALPPDAYWACHALGELMEQGTTKRSASDIALAFESFGGGHGASCGTESSEAHLEVVSSRIDEGLDLLADIALHPAFRRDVVDLRRANWLDDLAQEARDADALSWSAIDSALYPRAHPYGRAAVAKSTDVEAISSETLRLAYEGAFARDRATLVVVGDVSPADLPAKLERAFGAWPRRPARPPPSPVTGGAPEAARIVLVDLPGTTQSGVYLAEPTVSRDDPRYDAFTVADVILGGLWMSRINANLREKRGWSYWMSAWVPVGHAPVPLRIGGSVVADKTAPMVPELLAEVRRMTEELASDQEVKGAERYLAAHSRGRFQTISDVGFALDELVTYGRPLDDFATLPARLDAITPQDVLDAARAYLHPNTIKVFVVGDRAKVEGPLRSLAMGEVEVRDAHGDVVKREAGSEERTRARTGPSGTLEFRTP